MPRDMDKRKLLSKDRLSAVMGYVKTLESLLLDHGIALPDRPDVVPPLFAKNNDNHAVPRNETENTIWRDLAAQASLSVRSWSLPSQTSNNISTVMEQLTDTVGSMQIAEDGEFHYFGATSNLHILHVGSLSLPETFINASNQQRQEDILRAYGVDYEVDEELENHLVNLYFSWEDPNIPVVDQHVYFEEKKRCRSAKTKSRKYSEVLTNAMFVFLDLMYWGAKLRNLYSDRSPTGVQSEPR
ncbi:hypothetical protein ZTR_07393 [Talaromyces verruculosus]|nr:hypothetical protein ZTR_07393 [Talaromyces verruculosus]